MSIWQRFIRVFTPQKSKENNGALPEKIVADNSRQGEIHRIRQALEHAHAHERTGNEKGIWTVKAASFYDAFRFIFRICSPNLVAPVMKGGHMCFEAYLPEGRGRLLLSDKTGNRRNTLAVMTVEVADLPDIKEIRFCVL